MPDSPTGIDLYPTIPEHLTGTASGAPKFSGGLSQSLGGSQGLNPIPLHFPFTEEIEFSKASFHTKQAICSWHRLFKDFSAAQLTAGRTVYRGLMLHNGGRDYDNLKVWLTQPGSGTAITVALETPSNDAIQRVAGETSAPAAVVFTSPTNLAMLNGPAVFAEEELLGIWVKQVVTAGETAYPFDYWGLHVEVDDYDTRSWYFFQHLLTGCIISSVSSTRVSGVQTYVNRGETFTISTTLAGVATDPGESKVFVLVSGPSGFGFGNEFDIPGIEVPLEICDRTSAGVYTFQWRPPVPGFYTLEFNIGEDFYRMDRNVLP